MPWEPKLQNETVRRLLEVLFALQGLVMPLYVLGALI